ncbi:MAG: biotin transporter BioY [Actinobacteria bacterium]|nr:biotin transporter BioY [Actinomycetota bacterium]
MSQAPLLLPRPVLADLVPRTAARGAVLVVGGALLTAAAAQVFVPLPFSPVPISGQTFAVLLTAAALGPLRALASQGLYLALATAGLPFYAGGESGLQYAAGATGGYLIGFLAASVVVGACARRGLDRRPLGTAAAFAAGSLTIYALGVPWLAAVEGLSPGEAVRLGLVPFLVGDALKALLAAAFLPGAWALVGDPASRGDVTAR